MNDVIKQNPFSLKLGRESLMLYLQRDLDEKFMKYAAQVKDRDQHQCQFCGFQSMQCMKVINLDHNYRNNMMSNLVTSCPFCIQALFIEGVGTLMPGGGTLLYLPEISQAKLSALTHVLFAAIVNGSSFSAKADSYLKTLKLRAKDVEKAYGKGMSDPAFMGKMLIDTPDVSKIDADLMLKDLRLLPSLKHFEADVLSWAQQAQDI